MTKTKIKWQSTCKVAISHSPNSIEKLQCTVVTDFSTALKVLANLPAPVTLQPIKE